MCTRTWALVEFSKPMFDVVCILMEYSKLVTYLIKYLKYNSNCLDVIHKIYICKNRHVYFNYCWTDFDYKCLSGDFNMRWRHICSTL